MSTEEELLIENDAKARKVVRNDLSRTLFVEAGAGTGKTTALVGRILELVLTTDERARRPLNQIAAITFTEAAAAELRERVRSEFEIALIDARENKDARQIALCEEALSDTDIAAIQTLHGFAQRLLSEHPIEVGIPPRVEVIDAVRSQLAFNERWSGFLDTLYQDPDVEEFIVRASILDVKLSGPDLRKIAQTFDGNWDRLAGIKTRNDLPITINFAGVAEAIHQIEALESMCSNPEDKLLVKIRENREPFARFADAKTDHERLRLVKTLSNISFGNTGSAPNWGGDVVYAKETCKELREVCCTILGEVADQTLEQFAGRMAEFTVDAANERRAEGVLEFHDLLVLAQQLLETSPEAREGLAARYRVLMLDEFQDTDPIQISLALLLASSVEGVQLGPWNELDAQDGRLFMVGDPKQSIYRFRRADIKLFLEARAKFGEGSVSLQQNFRTVKPIIDAVNGFFDEIMPENTEAQAKYSPLIPNRLPSPEVDHRPLMLGDGHEAPAEKLREIEADEVAEVIADIMANPQRWPVGDGLDAEKNTIWRDPELSDITVLLPTRSSMKQLGIALDARNIAFRADSGSLVYETQEIRDLLSVLRAIDDPSDEIATVAALRSPLYACGYDDLYAFSSAGGKFSIEVRQPDDLLGTIVSDGLAHLSGLAEDKWWLEPSELLIRLIDERYVLALSADGRRARDAWRRIRYVVDQARSFAEAGGGDLRAYLDWTDLQGSDGSRESEPMLPEPDDIAVRVMTIHGSKGLEFPITVLSGMTSGSSGGGRGGAVRWGDPGALPEVKIKAGTWTNGFDELDQQEKEHDSPEKDRLLYVAFTRARDHLIVSGVHELKKSGEPKPSMGSKVYQWGSTAGVDLVRRLEPSTDERLHYELADDELAADVGEQRGPSVSDEKSLQDSGPTKVMSHTDWADAHNTRLTNGSERSTISATGLARAVAAGTSVNEVLPTDVYSGSADEFHFDEEDDEEPQVDDLPPRVFKRGRAGTAIGTAVHGVLQFLDLANPQEDAVDSLSESQAWAESVPEHTDTVRSLVRSVLAADIVKQCATQRHHKELYVAAPVGSITVEGYVDLLVDTPEGLVVVDYKTDSVNSEAEVDAKLAHYALQGTAYALAIESATGLVVCDVQFVFAKAGGPIVRSVNNLDEQRRAVLTAVGQVSA